MAKTKVPATPTHEIDITPDVTLFRKIGSQPYRIPDAVAELVDNEIDAQPVGEKLVVTVTLRMGKESSITVQGNGSGMDADTAAKAMKMAHSLKGAEQIGEFGLGMKAACSNLGKRFELVTAIADADRATLIVYDEEEFVKAGTWRIRLQETDKPFTNGTRITITDLKVNVYAGLKDTMLKAFGRIFRHFIKRDDVQIIVNEELVVAEDPKLQPQYTKEFAFEVDGHKVYGWYGLQEKYSLTGGYGFDLIRNGRALRKHEKIGFKQHPRLARLCGEIHLNTFPVTNNKMDFVRDTPTWREFDDVIKKQTAEIRAIAGKLASKKIEPKDQVRIEETRSEIEEVINSKAFEGTIARRGLDQILTANESSEDGEELPVDVEQRSGDNGHKRGETNGGDGGNTDGTSSSPRKPRLTHERLRKVKASLPDLALEHETVALGSDSPYKKWDIVATTPVKKLAVVTNLDHPMYTEVGEDLVLWVKHNIVEAAAEYLCQEGISEMLLLKSDILKHIGRMNLEEITAAPELD